MRVRSIHILLLFSALLVCEGLKAQDLMKDYVPLRSEGKLPEDFIVSASSKANQEMQRLEKKTDKASKEKMKFIISSTFFLDNVLKSGKVLYGDPISTYVNNVAAEIIKTEPRLKGKIRVYVVKSPVVNAYTFDNGVVLVNTGLISQLENEAQLAFVLCHEFTHYLNKHEINAYIDFIKMDKNRKSYNRNGTDLLLEKSKYSQNQELEADGEGFELYARTKYSYKSIDGLFDVLQYSYLPFEDDPFDKNFFNDKSLIIPSSYYLDKVKDVKADDNYNDSLSTHPNIAKRRAQISTKIGDKPNEGRSEFTVSESEFKNARDISRFETCRLYMLDLDYCDAIYSAFILLKQYPDNIYLKKIVARSLYEVAAYKTWYDRYTYTMSYENNIKRYYKKPEKSGVEEQIDYVDSIQGSSQQIFYLLHKLNAQEVAIVALNNNWKLNQVQGYEDPYTKEVCDSLFQILTVKDQLKLEDFSAELPVKQIDTIAPKDTIVEPEKELSKYDKIKRNHSNKNEEEKLEKDDFTRFAFVDILRDAKFVERYKEFQSGDRKSRRSPSPTSNNGSSTAEKREERSTTDPTNKTDSVRMDKEEIQRVADESYDLDRALTSFKMLGINKIVIVDPFYMKLDMRKGDNISYFSGEQKQKEFSSLLVKNANRLHLDYAILDPNTFSESDLDKYNDFSLINDWVAERLAHGDFDNPMVLNNEFKQRLLKKFGTNYFMWTGAISTHEKKDRLGWYILGSIIPYTMPFCIGYVVLPKFDTYFYSIVFNIETGKLELFNEHAIDMKDRVDVLNSMIYDTFYQVKTPSSN